MNSRQSSSVWAQNRSYMIIDHVSLIKSIRIDAWQRVIADILLKLALAAHTESACSGSLARIEHFARKERASTKLAPEHATLKPQEGDTSS